MLQSNNTFDITNVIFDQEIYYGKNVRYFKDIPDVTPIPTDSIIYKTVTGIGATHSEIVALRDSIIVLPHISIVTSKHDDYKLRGINTLAVYGKVSKQDIFDYLSTCVGHAKILTTPKGLNKIIGLLEGCTLNGKRVSYESLFFLLVDECHKLIQDAAYRADMVEMMEHFFKFEQKAMISATPIPPSDVRFREKKFKHIKVCPDYSYQQPVSIIPTDSVINTLNEYFSEHNAECYCIFFNSVEGIKSVITQTNISDDYVIFCSKESSELLKLADEPNVSNSIGGFKRYNFFTSSFFNGLDIHMNIKPDVLILTDYGYRDHTLLDPYTDILQIIGRFRKTDKQRKNKEQAYRKVTHINNAKYFTNALTYQNALLKIEHSRLIYDHLMLLKHSLYDNTFIEFLDKQLKTVRPYTRLLTENGDFCHFLKDNFLDDERVKAYYANTAELLNAYTQTGLYTIKAHKRQTYGKKDIINLKKKSNRYSIDMNKRMADDLRNLEWYKGTLAFYEAEAEIEKLSPIIYDAYNRLGYARINELKFKLRPIRIELLKLNIENKLNYFPLINMIHMTFQLNVKYTVNQVKKELMKIFEKFNIQYKAKSTDVLRYFDYKETKKDDDRAYVFLAQRLYQVSPRQHI